MLSEDWPGRDWRCCARPLAPARSTPAPIRAPHPPAACCSDAASEAFDMVYEGGKQDDICILCAAIN